MAHRESAEGALVRRAMLARVQEEYQSFQHFLDVCMDMMGFRVTRIQRLIAQFLEYGPKQRMIQAQRSQAKTTITACYAVWRLIHNPAMRILIVSGAGAQAKDIAILIIRIINTLPELECMRPDASAGDREATDSFEVHHSLRETVEKSASVACVGVYGGKTGKRADLLIADDIETPENSETAIQREKLLNRSKEFADLCASHDIIYLGTPQTSDSIYNTLEGRGYTVRIWPGRYPNADQVAHYGNSLCPVLARELEASPELGTGHGLDGTLGQATDPELLDDQALYKKEIDHGSARFQLQQMLLTALMDANRRPLKTHNLIVCNMPDRKGKFPLEIHRGIDKSMLVQLNGAGSYPFNVMRPMGMSVNDVANLEHVVMYVDPAGGGKNADATGYAIGGYLNGNIWLLAAGGVKGGSDMAQLLALAELAVKWEPDVICIEKNFGYGTFQNAFSPVLAKACKEAKKKLPGLAEDYVTGQKEKRIIDTLEPILGRGALIINESIVQEEIKCAQIYPLVEQKVYGLFFQMNHITYDRDSLAHDDTLDALEGLCRHFAHQLLRDQEEASKKIREREFMQFVKDPFGNLTRERNKHRGPNRQAANMLNKRRY